MEKFHLIFIPTDKKGLIISMEYTCRNVDAAREYATMQLLFSNGQFGKLMSARHGSPKLHFARLLTPLSSPITYSHHDRDSHHIHRQLR